MSSCSKADESYLIKRLFYAGKDWGKQIQQWGQRKKEAMEMAKVRTSIHFISKTKTSKPKNSFPYVWEGTNPHHFSSSWNMGVFSICVLVILISQSKLSESKCLTCQLAFESETLSSSMATRSLWDLCHS